MRLLQAGLAVIAMMASCIAASANPEEISTLVSRASDRYVFAHFMIGIVSDRNSASDYDSDMQRAKSYGIDAFALNIGVDSFTDQQLQYAYDSAANNGMKVFISFDFNWYHTDQGTQVGQKVAQYASKPGQFKVDGKVFVSSFAGDGVDAQAMRSAAGVPIYWAPNFHPGQGDFSQIDGALNWMGWPSDGNNKAPKPGKSVSVQDGDRAYVNALGSKGYIAPASPWFFTHYGNEVSYSKNWLFPGDLLWYQRWQDLLTLGSRFIEIVTWNDYGESHYIGPLSSKHYDDGASKWVNDMPHNGWLDMAKPFIAAYKAGATAVDQYITSDQLIYWYRPQPKTVDCSSTDSCMGQANNASGNYFIGQPDGYTTVSDSVFIISLLKSAGTLQVTSGGNTKQFSAPAGASSWTVPMGIGQQKFSLSRNSQTVLSGTSLKDIINGCVCGLWNYNAYVGTLPASFNDPLGPDGLNRFKDGLRVSTCSATPSLGTNPPTPTSTTASNKPSTTMSTITTTAPRATTPSTTPSRTTTQATTSTVASGQACVGGTGPDNYSGLCSFCCHYDYCPPGPCTCTSRGAPVPTPPTTGTKGVPKDGEDDSYSGLCGYACNHGYCPDTACKVVS